MEKMNDKERENAIKFMDATLPSKNKGAKIVCVKIRIHEDEAAGFIDGLIKYAEQMRIQSN